MKHEVFSGGSGRNGYQKYRIDLQGLGVFK